MNGFLHEAKTATNPSVISFTEVIFFFTFEHTCNGPCYLKELKDLNGFKRRRKQEIITKIHCELMHFE